MSGKKSSLILAILAIGVLIYAFSLSAGKLSADLSLPIPFSVQAPNNNWERNEDCEETSLTMANAYLMGARQEELPAAEAQNSINTLKAWEERNLGYNKDTGSDATARMAEGALGLKVRQIKDYTDEDLKKALNDGHPVLLPIDARKLNNPRYAESGPDYHMIVVRGYNQQGFIVHDPGTVTGKNNVYTFSILKEAAANWNEPEKRLEPDQKIALVLSK